MLERLKDCADRINDQPPRGSNTPPSEAILPKRSRSKPAIPQQDGAV
jgi:hypothetical protein